MNEEQPTYSLLEQINDPEDLRKIPVKQLPQVCKELRNDIIREVSRNPGHFGSSLGTVELTVALHYVFHTPEDLIIWDVGHQAYGHKILTGRREAFATNRQFKGIRPFPSPEESIYDTFACGHASNSISAALGMAVAAQLKGEEDKHVLTCPKEALSMSTCPIMATQRAWVKDITTSKRRCLNHQNPSRTSKSKRRNKTRTT